MRELSAAFEDFKENLMMVTLIQNQLGPNQLTNREEEQGGIAKVAAQIRDEKTKEISPSTSTNDDIQSLDVPRPTPEISCEDRTSIEGKFGWTPFGSTCIPYLMRFQKKYVALQMMNCNVLCNYKQCFTEEVYSCFKIEELKMTSAEAKLFNEINFTHCDNSLGPFVYPDTGRLISLRDAKEMYKFLNFCLEKLMKKSANTSKGGFMKPSEQSCIPYVWIDFKQYVPLLYLAGDVYLQLEKKSIELKGWKLVYMKLFCKIQGIGKHLFDHNSIRVVALELVKKFFRPGTSLQEDWPTEHKIESLIVNQTQQTSPHENNRENIPQKKTVSSNAQAKPTQGMKTTTATGKASSREDSPAMKTARPNAVSEQASFRENSPAKKTARPKPLPYDLANKPGRCTKDGNRKSINPTSPPSARPAAANSISSADNETAELNPIEFLDKNGRCKLCQIPDHPFDKRESPYVLMTSRVENKLLNYCINMYPQSSSVILISAEEIATSFFELPVSSLVKAINVLRLDIYLPNSEQIKLFDVYNVYPIMGLIKLSDFTDNISNIKTLMWFYTYC